ncbi:hypothetical protein C8R45DRAFT_1084768 [Mycena sanguinolenta]|nr:hypothetical protein C8R45DRAFT_1084768 [Mycena sanguinolenta]
MATRKKPCRALVVRSQQIVSQTRQVAVLGFNKRVALALFGVNTENIYKEADEHVNPHVSSPQVIVAGREGPTPSRPPLTAPLLPTATAPFTAFTGCTPFSLSKMEAGQRRPQAKGRRSGGATAGEKTRREGLHCQHPRQLPPRAAGQAAISRFPTTEWRKGGCEPGSPSPVSGWAPPHGPLLIARWGALASTPGRIFRHPTQAWVIPGAGSQLSCSLVVGPGLKTFGSNQKHVNLGVHTQMEFTNALVALHANEMEFMTIDHSTQQDASGAED